MIPASYLFQDLHRRHWSDPPSAADARRPDRGFRARRRHLLAAAMAGYGLSMAVLGFAAGRF